MSSGLRERKKERTRATITRAALELFARDGFAATTVSDIAAAADVSPRTVFTYFASKESIVFAEYRPSIDRLAARLAARQPEETVVDALRALAGRRGGHAARRRAASWCGDRERRARSTSRGCASRRSSTIRTSGRSSARETRELERIIAEAVAGELGVAPDSLAARVAGAATAAALLELNAHAARGGGAALESLDADARLPPRGRHWRWRNDLIFALA